MNGSLPSMPSAEKDSTRSTEYLCQTNLRLEERGYQKIGGINRELDYPRLFWLSAYNSCVGVSTVQSNASTLTHKCKFFRDPLDVPFGRSMKSQDFGKNESDVGEGTATLNGPPKFQII
jgi:hypothetical protein